VTVRTGPGQRGFGNGDRVAPEYLDVIDRFLARAAERPADPAILGQGTELSYSTVERRVRAIARALAQIEAPRVLIALPPSADAYASILATGLVGGYHTPLNLSAPVTKRRRIAQVLEPDIIIGDAGALSEFRGSSPGAGAIYLDPAAIADDDLFEGAGTRHHTAYVIFTSGSTGTPKGVVISRDALNHYVAWLSTLGYGPGDRVSQQPNLGFDISMTDIFGALCYGATLCPLESDADRLTPARFVARHGITVWNSTPSAISLMMRARQVTSKNLASVRLFNFCGEPLLREHLDALFAARPDARVQNTYGPTEATISMTALELTPDNFENLCDTSVAIGDPIPGMAYELVGGPDPDRGEIVISGPQVADGYWNDPDQTATKFRELPDGRRGYFTGDWAERRDGQVYFRERIDFQVKVKGYRVELDEVAAAIRSCGWPVACVFKWDESLAAVVEELPDRALDERQLKLELSQLIEAHAVPERVLGIAHMPRSENDKLDRQAAAQWFGTNV